LQDRDGHTTIFRPVACGNNNITRGYLSSQPAVHGARDGIAARLAGGFAVRPPRSGDPSKAPATADLAAGRPRTVNAELDRKGYRSVRISPEEIKASAETRIREAQSGRSLSPYSRAGDKQRYSQMDHQNPKSGVFDQFIGPDKDLTFKGAHVHVHYDEKNDEVRLHITLGEGPGRHSEKIALVGTDAREVNAAIDRLTTALADRC
jgi:hypothetical protein